MPLLTAPQLRRTDTVYCVSVFVGRLMQQRKGRKVSKTGKKIWVLEVKICMLFVYELHFFPLKVPCSSSI